MVITGSCEVLFTLHDFFIKTMFNLTFVDIIDYLGTFAFAISGLRLASEKQFDLFGAFIVGLATAVGGGTIRDVMIGVSPFWMNQWIYLFIVLLAVLAFLFLHKFISEIAQTIFLFDTIGLGLFTIVGFQKTFDAGFPFYTCIIMGMCTGAAGGVIRDILINEVPLIFRRDIYAIACLVGGLFLGSCPCCTPIVSTGSMRRRCTLDLGWANTSTIWEHLENTTDFVRSNSRH